MRNRVTVGLGIMAAVLTVTVAAQTDVTGKWNMSIDTDQGSAPATLTLTQDGEKLTGELVSDQGTIEFEGTIIGDKVAWGGRGGCGGRVHRNHD